MDPGHGADGKSRYRPRFCLGKEGDDPLATLRDNGGLLGELKYTRNHKNNRTTSSQNQIWEDTTGTMNHATKEARQGSIG